jgi:hypothetical protein
MTVAIRNILDEGYLIEVDDGTKNRYGQKEFAPNKDRIISDIFIELASVTERFTYTFRLDGKIHKKRRRFSYDDALARFQEDSQIKNFYDFLYEYFSVFCERMIAGVAIDNDIGRKNIELSYSNILQDFIYGMSVPSGFIEEYYGYLDEEEIFFFESKKLRKEDKMLERFREICSQHIILKNINKNSIMAKAVSIYQD